MPQQSSNSSDIDVQQCPPGSSPNIRTGRISYSKQKNDFLIKLYEDEMSIKEAAASGNIKYEAGGRDMGSLPPGKTDEVLAQLCVEIKPSISIKEIRGQLSLKGLSVVKVCQ